MVRKPINRRQGAKIHTSIIEQNLHYLDKHHHLLLLALSFLPFFQHLCYMITSLGRGIRAPFQVYRALAKLVERGGVHLIESVNGFVVCQFHDCGGSEVSIFMLCTQCEHAHEFTDTGIDNRLQSPGNNRGFQAAHKIIEITGLCADCQTSQTAAQKH